MINKAVFTRRRYLIEVSAVKLISDVTGHCVRDNATTKLCTLELPGGRILEPLREN